MFELLLNSACTLSRLPLFPAQISPNSGLGVDKKLGGDIWTDETNWPMGYFLPLTSFCNKNRRQRRKQQCGENKGCWLPRWLGISQLVGDGEWFLLCCLLFFPLSFTFEPSLLTRVFSHFCSSCVLSCPIGDGEALKWMSGCWLGSAPHDLTHLRGGKVMKSELLS